MDRAVRRIPWAAGGYRRLNTNVFVSPYSVASTFAMTYAGARGDTRDEMRQALRFTLNDDALHRAFNWTDLALKARASSPGFAIRLVGTLGGVGLVLAIAGLYGLVAYNVARRTREIGIRMAIGANPTNVLRLMMGKGLVLVAIGTAIGLALGLAVERAMNAALFHTGRVDFVAYLVVVPAMLLVTLVAAYVPARRAAQVAPTLALRCE